MAQVDRDQLEQLLGRGEVQARLEIAGPSEIWETAYAGVWWVRHALQDAIASSGPTRLPRSAISRPTKARAAQERAEQACGREMSLESASGLTRRQFDDLGPVLNAPLVVELGRA